MSGGFDFERHLKGIQEALKGVRMNFKPQMRQILEKEGEKKIIKLYVARAPIPSQIKKLADMINKLSGFEKIQHDKLFHLYLIIKLENMVSVVLEKNEELNMKYYKSSSIEEIKEIFFDKNLNITQLLLNSIDTYGANRIFIYDALTTNCQRFVLDILTANNINVSNDIYSFIIQDVKNLIPTWAHKIANFITSAYNRFKMAIYGYGTLNIHYCPICNKNIKNIIDHISSNNHLLNLLEINI